MNTKLFNVFMFATGAAIGSVVTWKLVKNKFYLVDKKEVDDCDAIVEEEDIYEDESDDEEPIEEEAPVFIKNVSANKPPLKEYTKMVEKEGYVNYSSINKPEEQEKEEDPVDEPYVIPPEEFGELDNYETISLTYYANGVLTDDQDNVIDDVDIVIGMEALSHFGEYEDDSVFVRNDRLKCDYEILLDYRSHEGS